jgi:hypothetical protein
MVSYTFSLTDAQNGHRMIEHIQVLVITLITGNVSENSFWSIYFSYKSPLKNFLLITNGMLFRQNVDYCVEIC